MRLLCKVGSMPFATLYTTGSAVCYSGLESDTIVGCGLQPSACYKKLRIGMSAPSNWWMPSLDVSGSGLTQLHYSSCSHDLLFGVVCPFVSCRFRWDDVAVRDISPPRALVFLYWRFFTASPILCDKVCFHVLLL